MKHGENMNEQLQNEIVSFIWNIADDCLRDDYARSKYRDVILPMCVIRRLDAVLDETREAVWAQKKKEDKKKTVRQEKVLCTAAGQAFYNLSPFRLKDLTSRVQPQKLKEDFEAYLDGFSENVKEILSKFSFHEQIVKMTEAGILGMVIERFVSPKINLSPKEFVDEKGNVLPALDNHAMGTVFEELIRRFNAENNAEAGEHFTPRDVVELMADLIIQPVADKIDDNTYWCYDGACGTGGMLTVAADRLAAEAARLGKTVNIRLYGQEVNPETYAIAKADLLLKGDGRDADNIKFGSTISEDGHEGSTFDFMLSNPPYGKSWKKDIAKMTGENEKKEKDDISDPRFTKFGYGKDNRDASFDMLPRSSDGQLLFLLNNVSKMKTKTALGSRIAEVHNGSSLFTGDAGQGESNARRYLVEKDLVEAIIALPENMFYNTGIGTFIWVLSNRKEEHRKGKIQLIDATAMKTPLRRNMGKKNCELSPEARREIVRLFMDFEETPQSKIFPNAEFGYWMVDILRPLRLKVTLTDETLVAFRKANPKDAAIADVLDKVRAKIDGESLDYNAFWRAVKTEAAAQGLKLAQGKQTAIRAACTEKDENAEPVVKKQAKGKAPEYESDSDLKDTERVPLLYEGGIERFFATEVKPYAEDAWVDEKSVKIGYEFSFTKYFYTPVKLRSREEIAAEFHDLEMTAQSLAAEIMEETE